MQLQKYYLRDRLRQVDKDFLEFEESNIDPKDIELMMQCIEKKCKLSNPHNSILLYLTGITNQFDFKKGRSDNYGGTSPDIDLDLSQLDEDIVKEWILEKYGREHVANVGTYGTFKPRSIARRYYSVTEKPGMEQVMAMIPEPKFGFEPVIKDIVEKTPEFKTTDPDFYRAAVKLENMISQFGIHAAGIVIADQPLHEVTPIWSNSSAERITQFDKDLLEKVGLLKIDLLKIDTLSIIKESCRLIKKTRDLDISPYEIPDGDEKAYSLLEEGLVGGIFQFEASGSAKNLIMKLKPRSISEISDLSALHRPGPMEAGFIEQYYENKNNGYAPSEMPDALVDFLKETYWVWIYQEQIMRACNVFAGIDLKTGDKLRKAIGKKSQKDIELFKPLWIEGCQKTDILDLETSERIWKEFVGFGAYG